MAFKSLLCHSTPPHYERRASNALLRFASNKRGKPDTDDRIVFGGDLQGTVNCHYLPTIADTSFQQATNICPG